MRACGFPEELLSAWIDGEAGARARDIEQHLERCSPCRETVEVWRQSGAALVQLVDAGVGEIDPLLALSRVRARVAAAEKRSPLAKLAAWWQDVWAFRRRALAGVAVAAALGAVTAPLLVLWAGGQVSPTADNVFAGVVIESMEWGGGSQAVIYQAGAGTTTLIWVEPDATKNSEGTAGY